MQDVHPASAMVILSPWPSNVSDMTSSRAPESLQPSFEDLGRHLRVTTFCVVDLETTGAGPESEITEIGAIKVCGGEPLGDGPADSAARPRDERNLLFELHRLPSSRR